jgi:hypothetical protein
MKISFITSMGVLPWAGSEELWLGAALALKSQGHEISAYYPKSRGWASPMDRLVEAGCRALSYGPGPRNWQKSLFKLKQKLSTSSFATVTNDRPWLESDLTVVSQGACMDALPWLLRLHSTNKKYAIICQANMESYWPDDHAAEMLNRVFSAAMAVYFVSEENERLFRIQTGYEGTNTQIIWNPLQYGTPTHALEWPTECENSWRMAMVGRIEPFAKGQDLMLEVLSMKKWRQRNLNVSIYGKGPWEGTARKIVSNRRLSNVRFGGFSTPEEIWSSHHMLALPSRHEGMSLAMLEAMWLGRPVIATAVAGAMSEVVTGYNGFLCQAPTVALWDEAMEEAWSQRHLWREIGANASRRIRQRMGNDPIQDLSIRLVTLPSE